MWLARFVVKWCSMVGQSSRLVVSMWVVSALGALFGRIGICVRFRTGLLLSVEAIRRMSVFVRMLLVVKVWVRAPRFGHSGSSEGRTPSTCLVKWLMNLGARTCTKFVR